MLTVYVFREHSKLVMIFVKYAMKGTWKGLNMQQYARGEYDNLSIVIEFE